MNENDSSSIETRKAAITADIEKALQGTISIATAKCGLPREVLSVQACIAAINVYRGLNSASALNAARLLRWMADEIVASGVKPGSPAGRRQAFDG
jgi:hypothetical protein